MAGVSQHGSSCHADHRTHARSSSRQLVQHGSCWLQGCFPGSNTNADVCCGFFHPAALPHLCTAATSWSGSTRDGPVKTGRCSIHPPMVALAFTHPLCANKMGWPIKDRQVYIAGCRRSGSQLLTVDALSQTRQTGQLSKILALQPRSFACARKPNTLYIDCISVSGLVVWSRPTVLRRRPCEDDVRPCFVWINRKQLGNWA